MLYTPTFAPPQLVITRSILLVSRIGKPQSACSPREPPTPQDYGTLVKAVARTNPRLCRREDETRIFFPGIALGILLFRLAATHSKVFDSSLAVSTYSTHAVVCKFCSLIDKISRFDCNFDESIFVLMCLPAAGALAEFERFIPLWDSDSHVLGLIFSQRSHAIVSQKTEQKATHDSSQSASLQPFHSQSSVFEQTPGRFIPAILPRGRFSW